MDQVLSLLHNTLLVHLNKIITPQNHMIKRGYPYPEPSDDLSLLTLLQIYSLLFKKFEILCNPYNINGLHIL